MFGMKIDTGPKLYAVASPIQYMTLRSRSQNFYVKFLQCQFCEAFDGFDSYLT